LYRYAAKAQKEIMEELRRKQEEETAQREHHARKAQAGGCTSWIHFSHSLRAPDLNPFGHELYA
jgi:hypothetical protein